MLESICFRRQHPLDSDVPLDLGLLAEAMIFYGAVRLAADRAMLQQLIRVCGPDSLIALCETERLKVTYAPQLLGIGTRNGGTLDEVHSPVRIYNPRDKVDDVVVDAFRQATGRSGRGRRLAMRFLGSVDEIEFPEFVLSGALEDFADEAYVYAVTRETLGQLAPEYAPGDFVLDVVREGAEVRLNSDIDFDKANQSLHLHIPPDVTSLGGASLLAQMLEVRGDLFLAAHYSAELATSRLTSSLVRLRLHNATRGIGSGRREIDIFHEAVLDGVHSVRDSINSGAASFTDLLNLLESAGRFREWLTGADFDEGLVRAYYEELEKPSWVQKLPVKAMRWVVVTSAAIGLAPFGPGGLIAGAGLAGFDSLLLEKLARGWRPSQFVEDAYRKFGPTGS
jgi:hypothetical protein